MAGPNLWGLDGRRLRHGRFLQERTWNFWDDADKTANGLVNLAATTGTVTVPTVGSGDSAPNRAVMTTAATNNDIVRIASPSIVSHRYRAIEFTVSRLAIDSANPGDLEFGISNGTSFNAGVIMKRTYATSVGTRQPWVLSERAGSPVDTETKILTYASSPCNNLTILWFPGENWCYILDGDAVLHSQATPTAADGTLRAFILVRARSAVATIAEISQMNLKLWHNV